MGFLDKILKKSQTDDKKEIAVYERTPDDFSKGNAEFFVSDVFSIKGRGTVAVGMVTKGTFTVGDKVNIKNNNGGSAEATIIGIEQFRKMCDSVSEGDNAGLLIGGIQKSDVKKDDLIVKY